MESKQHIAALKENNEKLLKNNTSLHAKLQHQKKELDQFKYQTKKKLEETIRLYDRHNENVIKYLEERTTLNDSQIAHIRKLFPIKLP